MITTNNSTRKLQRMIDLKCQPSDSMIRDRAREQMLWEQEIGRLSRVTTIEDEALLEQMLSVGIRADNVAALQLFPVAMAAWASGSVSSRETQVALQVIYSLEIAGQTDAIELFQTWLQERPDENMWQIWQDYVAVWNHVIGLRRAIKVGESIYRLAENVASASGGILGYAAICEEEEEVLLRIRQCYWLE